MSNGTDSVARRVPAAAVGGAEFLASSERLERCRVLAQQGYLIARVAGLGDGRHDGADFEAAGSHHQEDGLRHRLHLAIEHALAQRGALPSSLDPHADEHAWAYDQLARSRTVDAPGLCVLMPPVRQAAVDGALSASDSSVLRAWRAVAMVERVVLLFDEADGHVAMLYPQALCAVFDVGARPAGVRDDVTAGAFVAPDSGLVGSGACDRAVLCAETAAAAGGVFDAEGATPEAPHEPAAAHPALADRALGLLDDDAYDDELDPMHVANLSDSAMALGEEPWTATETMALGGDPLARQHAATLGLLFEALLEEPLEEPAGFVLEPAPESDVPTVRADALADERAADGPERLTLHSVDELGAMATETAAAASLPEGSVFDSPSSPPPGMADAWAPGRSSAPPRFAAADERARAELEVGDGARARLSNVPAPRGRRRPPARKDTSRLGRAIPLDHETCTRFSRELDASHGPQPVRTVEQLYRTRYAPLLETLSTGLEHEPARLALKGWRNTFSKSYGDGFTAIKLTGKRPPMVFDAPELAARVGRMHGAKGIELLLVDGLRFDLAQRAWRLVGARVGARAVCVEETLLWSALPTITPVQLKLLARGPGALKDLDTTSDSDPLVHRERSATTLRRLRLGSRDLLKLDVVEARLREAGGGFDERMAELADVVAEAAVELIATMPAGSLLYVFGDHGFRLPAGGADEGGNGDDSTPPAAQGGSSPEEVLTPAAAWLVGHGSDGAN